MTIRVVVEDTRQRANFRAHQLGFRQAGDVVLVYDARSAERVRGMDLRDDEVDWCGGSPGREATVILASHIH